MPSRPPVSDACSGPQLGARAVVLATKGPVPVNEAPKDLSAQAVKPVTVMHELLR